MTDKFDKTLILTILIGEKSLMSKIMIFVSSIIIVDKVINPNQ